MIAAGLFALSLAAALSVPLRRVVIALDLLLGVAVAVDFARTPRPDRLGIARRAPARAGLSTDFVRVIRVDPVDPGGQRVPGLSLELREEFPAAFEVSERSIADGPGSVRRGPPQPADPTGGPDTCVLGERPIDLARVYRSNRRGSHALLDLRVRLTSPWGLLQRQSRMRGETKIDVDPPLSGIRRTLRLAASERWRDLGVRVLRRRGGLMEFESLRDYVHGDDLRVVDWKAFAKRGRPIVREFQEERGQELVLCIDCGRRMGVAAGESSMAATRVRGWTKLDHALDAGLQIAAVALKRGDRVGCLAFDSRVRAWIPPGRGGRQLERLRESVFALQASELETDLGRALRELALLHRRRALVLILSEIADPLSVDEQRRALAAGSKMHKILFAALDDPSLRAAAEGTLPVDAAVRAAAITLQDERRAGLRRLHGVGVRVLDTLPAEAAAPLLAAWLEARRGS